MLPLAYSELGSHSSSYRGLVVAFWPCASYRMIWHGWSLSMYDIRSLSGAAG